MGTTGVAMVLIHPLLRANAHRARKVHLVVFFIVLVANAGGATTPLGDPPLYLGFLQGVPFDWPLRNLTIPLLAVAPPLLAGSGCWTGSLARGEPPPAAAAAAARARPAQCRCWCGWWWRRVLPQGVWHPGEVVLLGQTIGAGAAGRHAAFAAITAASLLITPRTLRERNLFSWEPMREVAVLFAAIFITIAPVLDDAGRRACRAAGAAAGADHGRQSDSRRRWPISGWPACCRRLLDNAPTYLVFFKLAGGDPAALTGGAGAGAAGAVGRRGVLRRADLYRQRAQHDGARHRRAARRAHAGVLRLHRHGLRAAVPLFALLSVLFFFRG